MKGKTYQAVQYQHLTAEETRAEMYDADMAQYAANLLTMLRNKVKKKVEEQPNEKCFLITYSLKKGINKFKEKGSESATSEMQQLHDRDCWHPIHISTLSQSEKKKALESLIFLVEKKTAESKPATAQTAASSAIG